MFKSIEKISDFGVFPNFSKMAGTNDFVEKNIIYGWNYSGKTTVSRIFSCVQNKDKHIDYPSADFNLIRHLLPSKVLRHWLAITNFSPCDWDLRSCGFISVRQELSSLSIFMYFSPNLLLKNLSEQPKLSTME